MRRELEKQSLTYFDHTHGRRYPLPPGLRPQYQYRDAPGLDPTCSRQLFDSKELRCARHHPKSTGGIACACVRAEQEPGRPHLPVIEKRAQRSLDRFEDVTYARFLFLTDWSRILRTVCILLYWHVTSVPQLCFHRPIKRLKLVCQILGLVERCINRKHDPIRVPADILQFFLACGDFDEWKVRVGKGVDAFDDPGGMVVEGDGDFAFEGAGDACGDVCSGEDGVDDKGGDVDGSVDVCGCGCGRGRRRRRRERRRWCGRSLAKERCKCG